MAEAAAALGIAAAAVQFFDFSLKALSLCKQIRDSEKGATQANQELETYIGKLKQIHENLKADTRLQVADRPITKARQDCIAVVDELVKLLSDVKSKAGDKNFAAAKAVFRVMRNKRSIEVLQNKLSQAQARFMSAVSVETKNDVVLLLQGQDKLSDTIQKTVLPELRKAHAASAAGHKQTQDQLGKVAAASTANHGKTHSLLQDVQKDQESSLKVAKSTQVAMSKGLTTIETQINSNAVNAEASARRKQVMDSLWYPEMFDRQRSIKPPLFKSFEWIFDDSPASEGNIRAAGWTNVGRARLREATRGKFARWLCEDGPLFWISGKAGSGKSSLMSLIQSDSRTDEALSVWASGRRLYRFSFYFWRPGTSLQKTIHGLVRSLLYQLAGAKSAVVNHLAATESTRCSDWTTASLLTAFRKCLSAFRDDRIFLMVDGLDEFEGNYDDLLEIIMECQQEPFLKVCVSSRPETRMLNQLSTYPFLRLQDLNYNDIALFVEAKLKSHRHCISSEILRELIERAEGVFLWAVLVSEDIQSGAADGDDTDMLRERLGSMPNELCQLYERLFEKINDVHLETMKVCLFHLDDRFWRRCRNDQKHRSLGYITTCIPGGQDIKTSEEFLDCCTRNSTRLIAQGKGLLEIDNHVIYQTGARLFDSSKNRFFPVSKNIMELCQRPVKFVHRSAYDFMLGLEGAGGEQSRWHLTEGDIDRFIEGALRGCKTLIRFMPLWIHNPGVHQSLSDLHSPRLLGTHIIDSFVKIVVDFNGRKHDHIIGGWLDRIYDILPEHFATQGVALLSPAARKAWSSEVDLSYTWHAEETFWVVAAELDGYLESRWNKLAGHPHAGAICSRLLLRSRPGRGLSLELTNKCQNKIFAEADSAKSPPITKCIRGAGGARAADSVWTISWDATGALDEQYIMANMGQFLLLEPSSATHDVVSDRGQRVFMGAMPLSWPLQIQVSIPSGLMWQFGTSLSQLPVQGIKHIRLLSVAPQDDKKVCQIPYTFWEVYGDLVDSICDVPVEFREAVPVHTFRRYGNDGRRACFTGTRSQFVDCLTQVKDGIRANKNSQLSPSGQLSMLDLVQEHFEDHWLIITPETSELSEITLETRWRRL